MMGHCIVAVVLTLSMSLAVAVPARASVLQEKIDKVKHTLEQVRRDIEKTRKQLNRSRKKHGTVRRTIEDLDRRLHNKRDEVQSARRDLKQRKRTMTVLSDDIAALQSRINGRKAMLASRVRRLYMDGHTSWFRPLLSADSYMQFQHRVVYLSTLNEWENRELKRHRLDMAHLEQRRAQHEQHMRAAQSTERRLANTLQTMEDDMSRARVVLAGLAQQTQSHKDSLVASENRKEALINTLYRRGRIPATAVAKHASGSFRKGTLLWPVEGEPVGAFGRQKHPAFDTYIDKKGIEIQTEEGENIRAVAGGTVVYADWLKGYGLVVILDHGASYLTFYAHASGLQVTEGQTVAQGAVLGKTGASGLTDRVVLYFELREGIKPVNPSGWFAR